MGSKHKSYQHEYTTLQATLPLPFKGFILPVLLIVFCWVLPTRTFAQVDTVDTAEKTDLNSPVHYKAKDSIIKDLRAQKIYLFGEGEIHYESIDLTAGYVEFDMKNSQIYARGIPDSTGQIVQKPIFSDGNQKFETDEITYNYKNKKGLVTEVRTEISEGHIDGDKVKIENDSTYYIADGKYCPCNDPDAETYFQVNKLKVLKDDKIVTGAGYMKIGEIPTPLAFPFAIFPNTKRKTSGILLPRPGESPAQGFYLQNGGYYFNLGDHFDTQITGDIYSRGSWALMNNTRYKFKYRFNGNVSLRYNMVKTGYKELKDDSTGNHYSQTGNFFIKWSHIQDAKSNPYLRFAANLNFGSTQFFRQNLNTQSDDFLRNNFSSNISLTKTFPKAPFTVSLNARHSQNTATKVVSASLPVATVTMRRIYPFGKINTVKNPWLKKTGLSKLGLNYSAAASNTFQVQDSLLDPETFDYNELKRNFKNGIRQNANLSTNIPVTRYINFTPAVNWSNQMYFKLLDQAPQGDTANVLDTLYNQFDMINDFNVTGAFTTKLYSMLNLGKGALQKARHTLTPSVSWTYRPEPNMRMRDTVYYDVNDSTNFRRYSPYDLGAYGPLATGVTNALNVNLVNRLELKIRDRKDTITGSRKVVLLDNFAINGSYNFMADSMNLSFINMTGRTTLFKTLNVRYRGTFDPYATKLDTNENLVRFNRYKWQEGQGYLGLNSININTSYQIKSKKKTPKRTSSAHEDELKEVEENPDDYISYDLPWRLALDYNLNINRRFIGESDTLIYNQTLGLSGDVSITQKWKVGFRSGFDIEELDITYTNLSVFRDLNCWELRFNWTPFGQLESYSFTISMKPSIMKDLRLTRRSRWYD